MPTGVYPRRPAIDRFLEKVERDGLLGCWTWTGAINWGGYGMVNHDGRHIGAHRAAYLLLVGPIPADKDVDHRCHNDDATCLGGPTCLHRRCVNPAHLEPVSHAENLQRAAPNWAPRWITHCVAGHPRSPDNTYMRSDKKSTHCRVCARQATRRWRERRSDAA